MTAPRKSIWLDPEFRSYISSTGFTGVAFAMQSLLVSWLLIGILLLPADQVGLIQAFIGLPGILLMLWGGSIADRTDPRSLLIGIYRVAPIFPCILVLVVQFDGLGIISVMLFGLGMSVIGSYSTPAQQAILNRVTGTDVQKGVTASTAVGFLVQMLGLTLAGQMEILGLTTVLLIQAISLAAAAIMFGRLSTQPPAQTRLDQSVLAGVLEGMRETFRHKVIFNVLVINFISSIFNAGAFITVFPFILKRIYAGDALLLALMMIVFYAGAMVSNLLMYRYMPFRHPGRVFLLMQLSRIIILLFLWIKPDWWLLVTSIILWGLNMGVTSTLARTIVQESAKPAFRARILSVFTLGLLGSAPIGALVLGWIIEGFGTLNALLPAMLTSLLLCIYGLFFTGIWRYTSPTNE